MATASELPVHPMYVRHVNTDGGSYVDEHWVWDSKLWLTANMELCAKANEDALKKDKDAPALAMLEVVDRAAYCESRGWK